MFFREHSVEVYRYDTPASNWGDPTLLLNDTLFATIQPFTSDDGNHDNQMMQNVREMLIFSSPDVDIKYGDILKYFGVYHRIAYINPCRSGVLEHCEVFISSTPFEE
jgi:hypothetical protein